MIMLSDKESWKKVLQMQSKELVQSIIGNKGFVLEDITVGTEVNEIKLSVCPAKQEKCPSRMLSKAWRGDRAVPWAWPSSRFTKVFEETAAWFSTHASRSMVSGFMRLEWHTVGNICTCAYQELETLSPSRFNGLVNIGINETNCRKCRKHTTVIVNHDTSRVVWCAPGYGKEVLTQFFELLTQEQRASIRCASADGVRWIASCVE